MLLLNEFVETLIAAGEAERKELLFKRDAEQDLELATRLKDIAQEAWTTDPARTQQATEALIKLAKQNSNREIHSLANWASGITALTRGDNQAAIDSLENAASGFRRLKKETLAAQTQVALLYALALQGDYDRAIAAGRAALAVFLAEADDLSAAKIEKNLGSIFHRRDLYQQAEEYYKTAEARFEKLQNRQQLAMINNCIAALSALQNDFHRAETYYQKALAGASAEKMTVTEAEIEASLGNLAIFRGRFDDALKRLEKSRNLYAALEMPHQTAIADLEIADLYLELNLLLEARSIYQRIAFEFESFKMQAEEARARINFGKTLIQLGETAAALIELKKAETLYLLEKNNVGAATVKLILGGLAQREKNYQTAKALSQEAADIFLAANSPRNVLLSQLAVGENEHCLKKYNRATTIFSSVLAAAETAEQPQIAWAAANALGVLAKEQCDFQAAEKYFKKAVKTIESLRSPIAGDEFRTAFFADKIAPYQHLADICRMDASRIAESLGWIERARSQSLLDLLFNLDQSQESTDDAALRAKFERLREELNWFYNRAHRANSEIGAAASEIENLKNSIRECETELNAVILHIKAGRERSAGRAGDFDLKRLQNELGQNRAIIEFAEFDGAFAAFVIDENKVELIENLGSRAAVAEILEQLHFQFGTLRYGAANLAKHLPLLKKRADASLQNLYEILLRPLEDLSTLR